MELWIPITIFAAFMQNVRSALQKYLKGRLSNAGATYTRFAFGAPLAVVYLAVLLGPGDYQLPGPNWSFVLYAMTGGLSQIVATFQLVYLFSFRNFAVGTAFSKTETIQTALFGIVVLSETVGLGGFIAILISLIGVILLSVTRPDAGLIGILRQCLERPALIGIAAGGLFGVSAITYRAASLSLEGGDFIIRAAFTLACVTLFQTLVMTAYLNRREPGQITTVLNNWRPSVLVGISGVLGSAGWFTAMTLQNAAYVRALGQIELIFTFAAAYLFFKERPRAVEIAGIALITAGILLLLLWR